MSCKEKYETDLRNFEKQIYISKILSRTDMNFCLTRTMSIHYGKPKYFLFNFVIQIKNILKTFDKSQNRIIEKTDFKALDILKI